MKGVSPKAKYDIARLGVRPGFLEKTYRVKSGVSWPHSICQPFILVLRIPWICLVLQNQKTAVFPTVQAQNAALLF